MIPLPRQRPVTTGRLTGYAHLKLVTLGHLPTSLSFAKRGQRLLFSFDPAAGLEDRVISVQQMVDGLQISIEVGGGQLLLVRFYFTLVLGSLIHIS